MSDLISQAQAALEQGKAQQAYDSLAAAESDYAGNVDFDYWLGLSAVRAGQPARASFALERVIAEKPNHAGARLELATAYVQLGQRDAAAEQLDRLETLNPPPQAQERIDAINNELNRQAKNDRERRNGGYVGIEAGTDDNVGTWPQGLEFFPGATLDAIDSTFGSLKGGYWHSFKVGNDQKVTLNANGMLRRNQDDDAKQFDQDYLGGRAEWSRDLDGRNEVAAAAEITGLNLDGKNYYRMFGTTGEWRRKTMGQGRWIGTLALRKFDFDLDQYSYVLSRLKGRYETRVQRRWNLSAEVNLDYEAGDVDRPGGDATVYGVNGMAWYQLALKHRLGASLGYAHAEYHTDYQPGEAINNTDAQGRDDNRLSASLLYDWYPGTRWQVRGQAMYRKQDSSLDAFTYDQTVLSAGLNYYF